MNQMTELILEGVLCEQCGGFIDGEETGYSRTCEGCVYDEIESEEFSNDG